MRFCEDKAEKQGKLKEGENISFSFEWYDMQKYATLEEIKVFFKDSLIVFKDQTDDGYLLRVLRGSL